MQFSTCTGKASGLLSKKQYAVSAEQMFMMKLCTERCLECTMFALFLSKSLMHSMTYLLRSIILLRVVINVLKSVKPIDAAFLMNRKPLNLQEKPYAAKSI